jgi:hypothetical protein
LQARSHSKLSTTDRYVSAKHRPEDFERLNRAFTPSPPEQPAPAAADELVCVASFTATAPAAGLRR